MDYNISVTEQQRLLLCPLPSWHSSAGDVTTRTCQLEPSRGFLGLSFATADRMLFYHKTAPNAPDTTHDSLILSFHNHKFKLLFTEWPSCIWKLVVHKFNCKHCILKHLNLSPTNPAHHFPCSLLRNYLPLRATELFCMGRPTARGHLLLPQADVPLSRKKMNCMYSEWLPCPCTPSSTHDSCFCPTPLQDLLFAWTSRWRKWQ